jgi:hypothetical protein
MKTNVSFTAELKSKSDKIADNHFILIPLPCLSIKKLSTNGL